MFHLTLEIRHGDWYGMHGNYTTSAQTHTHAHMHTHTHNNETSFLCLVVFFLSFFLSFLLSFLQTEEAVPVPFGPRREATSQHALVMGFWPAFGVNIMAR